MADKRKSKRRKDDHGNSADDKPTKQEYTVAKWLKANVPTKKTKFLNHPVQYFTGAKAVDALLSEKFTTDKEPMFASRGEAIEFCHQMLLHKFFHRAKKVPVSEQELKGKTKKKDAEKMSKSGDEKDASQASACEGNDKDKDNKDKENKDKEKKKRKIRLEMHAEQLFLDTADAYVWIFDPMPWYYWLCGALVVLATVAICMFPLWPPPVRKGVYYLSLFAAGFLVLIIALAAIRLIVFCTVWVLSLSRHHLWVLPNLTEDVGFFASFWPLYIYEYRGPEPDGDKASKGKKKRKKDKQSDEEGDDSTAPSADPSAPPTASPTPHGDSEAPVAATEAPPAAPAPPAPPESDADANLPEDEKKASESESENSQRSSTDRDFEILERAELDDADNPEQPLLDKKST